MKYLEMEHERLEMMQSIKEAREKRSFTMLQLLISLAAIVIVVFLLRDNPTVLVNILYIVGIIIVLWILKGPHEKNPFKRNRKMPKVRNELSAFLFLEKKSTVNAKSGCTDSSCIR